MTADETKKIALLETAEAFLARGNHIQYDQLSMDRIVRVSPRHSYFCTPETATEQHTLYLDCAHFVCAVYYAAFGVRLEADVTWNMMTAVKPRVYHYTLTHRETHDERSTVWHEVRSILQPGDVIVMRRSGPAGHIILCGEGDTYYECNHLRGPDSYRYDERYDAAPHGGLYRKSLCELFDANTTDEKGSRHIFSRANIDFAVLRPLERVGKPTADTCARLGSAKGLFAQVLSSHPSGASVRAGDTVTYRVYVRNDAQNARTVDTVFTPPTQGADAVHSCRLQAGEHVQLDFHLRVENEQTAVLPPPMVTLNGMRLWAPHVLVEGNIPPEELRAAMEHMKRILPEETDIMAAASKAYAMRSVFRNNAEETLRYLYHRYDSVCGDVLWRGHQAPYRDATLYGYFGGTGVITPELGDDMTIRTQCITRQFLREGDIILCSDDALFTQTYGCVAAEDGLSGRFSFGGSSQSLCGRDADAFIESLPGRFCYTVFRPAMLKR